MSRRYADRHAQVARWFQPAGEMLIRTKGIPAYDFASVLEQSIINHPDVTNHGYVRGLVSVHNARGT